MGRNIVLFDDQCPLSHTEWDSTRQASDRQLMDDFKSMDRQFIPNSYDDTGHNLFTISTDALETWIETNKSKPDFDLARYTQLLDYLREGSRIALF